MCELLFRLNRGLFDFILCTQYDIKIAADGQSRNIFFLNTQQLTEVIAYIIIIS